MKIIPRIAHFGGEVAVPPSKSFTARALLLAAMTEGETKILNALDCDDSRYMLDAIKKIGFEVSGSLPTGVTIGTRRSMSANEVEIDVGNAGTAMRFLTGFLVFTPGRFLLTGSQRMQERPIGDLVEALRGIGAEIEYLKTEGVPPLSIRGRKMRGGFEVTVSGDVSSQFVSSVMMGGATLPGGITVRIPSSGSRPYIAMTRQILEDFGVKVAVSDAGLQIRGENIRRDVYTVEGDFSSASYWLAAAAATGGKISFGGLNRDSVQGDKRFISILESMGCQTLWSDSHLVLRGPERLAGGTFDCNDVPDLVPALAAICPLASSPVRISGIRSLRFKESDRIAVLASELRKLGVTVKEEDDALEIHPGWNTAAATIDPHDDHRIAMSFAAAGPARGNLSIASEGVVSKSYPRFWRTFDELVDANQRHGGDAASDRTL